MIAQFYLDESFFKSVTKQTVHDYVKDRNNPTPEETLMILRGYDTSITTTSIDHPEFTKLREELGKRGYIKIERGWWNGDRVEKTFKLNEWLFKKGDKFASASALGNAIKYAKQVGRKRIAI